MWFQLQGQVRIKCQMQKLLKKCYFYIGIFNEHKLLQLGLSVIIKIDNDVCCDQ